MCFIILNYTGVQYPNNCNFLTFKINKTKKEKTPYEQESWSNTTSAIGFIIIIILAMLGNFIFNNL